MNARSAPSSNSGNSPSVWRASALSPGSPYGTLPVESCFVTPDPEGYLGRDASWSEVWKAILATGGEGTAEAAGGDGVRRLYGFTRMGDQANRAEVFLSLGVPTDVAFADLRRLERRNLLVLALVTTLAVGLTWLGGERLLVRLFGRMQTMAERDSLTGLSTASSW